MIEVQDVTKRYGPTVAVDGLSFEVREGEVTSFLGPNDAGRSTTMRMMVRLDAPTSGRFRVVPDYSAPSPWAGFTVLAVYAPLAPAGFSSPGATAEEIP